MRKPTTDDRAAERTLLADAAARAMAYLDGLPGRSVAPRSEDLDRSVAAILRAAR